MFNRILCLCNLWLLSVLLLLITVSTSYAEHFTIEAFHSEIVVHKDSSIVITERIDVLFGSPRHGIYRDIPYRYIDDLGRKVRTPLKVISVTNEANRKRKYKVTRKGDVLRVRIGDPDTYVTGRQAYQITYQVENIILFFDGHDELYWNVTGDRWNTSIKNASATVILMGERGSEKLLGACYTGRYGSSESSCRQELSPKGADFRALRSLGAAEGFTVSYGWDKGLIREPSGFKRLLWRLNLRENWVFVLPVLSLVFMFSNWYWRGRDPRVVEALTVRYTPPQEGDSPLLPAEAGAIVDERFDSRDITASIVNLAVKGYITIEEIEKAGIIFNKTDYYLKRVREPDGGLNSFERRLIEDLFTASIPGILISGLKNSFYKKIDGLRESLFSGLISNGYFSTMPYKVRNRYNLIGSSLIIAGLVLGTALGNLFMTNPVKYIIAFTLSGLPVFLFGRYMPAKTRKGSRIYAGIKGFEEFLSRAEKDRLERMNDKNLFEKYLPYAIALDVSERWAEAFEDMYQEEPAWYVSPRGYRTFNTISFNRSLGSAISTMGQAMFSAPRSSGSRSSGRSGGGGFSGGGFGGGGGGSW